MGYPPEHESYGFPPYGRPPRRRGRHAISHLTVAILAALAAVLITVQVSHSGTGIGNLPGASAVTVPGSLLGLGGTGGPAAACNRW